MSGFFNQAEKIIKANGERGLEQLEFYASVKTEIYRDVNHSSSPYGRVHGHNQGKDGQHVDTFFGVYASDDFFASNDGFTGGFELGFMYTRSKKVKVGDTLKLKRDDGKIFRYKVESIEDIGFTTSVFSKWKISNIGD